MFVRLFACLNFPPVYLFSTNYRYESKSLNKLWLDFKTALQRGMAAKQRHIQKVRQRIIDKLQELGDQEEALHAVVREYVTKARVRAECVLGLDDAGQFLQQYNGVLQMLDGVYNTCELLTVSAEDMTANGGEDLFLDTFSIDARSVTGDTTLISPTSRLGPGVSFADTSQEPHDTVSPGIISATKHSHAGHSLEHQDAARDSTKTENSRKERSYGTVDDRIQTEQLGTCEPTVTGKSNKQIADTAQNVPKRRPLSPCVPTGVKEQFNKELGITSEVNIAQFDTTNISVKDQSSFDRQVERASSPVLHSVVQEGNMQSVRKDTGIDTNTKNCKEFRKPSSKLHMGVEQKHNVTATSFSKTKYCYQMGSQTSQDQRKDSLGSEVEIDDFLSGDVKSKSEAVIEETEVKSGPLQTTTSRINPSPATGSHRQLSELKKQRDSITATDTVTNESKQSQQTKQQPESIGEQSEARQTTIVSESCERKPYNRPPSPVDSVEEPCTGEDPHGYRKGPIIERGSLLEGNITPVLITDITSPWCFYVQPYGPQLNQLMEQICLYMAKSGLTDGPLKQPGVGTVCLARYSKDSAFYRALVTRVTSTGSAVTEVDVFFLDYGNQERVKVGQLRKLPVEYASLPTQAICCALAEVVPVNKYNVWTEEDILTFQQFVFGQQLRCMLVCHSSGPTVPYIVRLTMNYPVPATQGMAEMNMAYQYLAEISVGKLLVNKGQAKDIAVADQVSVIIKSLEGCSDAVVINGRSGTTLEITELTDAQVKDIEASQGQKDSSQGQKTSQGSGNKQGREGQRESKDTDNRVNPSTDRQGRKHFRIKHGTTSDDSGDTGVDNVEVSVSVNDGKADKYGKDDDIYSPRSETSETESQGDVNKDVKVIMDMSDSGSLQKPCVKSDEYLPTIKEEREVGDSHSVSSGKKEKVDPADETTSMTTATELDTTKNSADTGFMSGDMNVDLNENKGHEVMLSHVKSPGHFYLHIVSRQVGQTLDRLMKNLNSHFEKLNGKLRSKLSKSFTCAVNKKCCAKFSEDGHFYRAVIVSMDGTGGLLSLTSLVHVFYIDFGDDEWLPKHKLYPLPEQFAQIPPLALRCSLAFVKPLVLSTEDREGIGAHWPEKSTEKMVSMTGFDKKLLMHVIHGTLCTDNNGQVVGDDGSTLEILLVDHGGAEEICINMDMIREGEADLDLTHTPFSQKDKVDPESPDVATVSKDWNPMAQDFFSIRNSYNIDVDDPGVATTGYKAQDERRICKYFSKGQSCWREERCPYRHVLVHSGVTLDREEVYCVDNNQLEALPDVHSWVALEVSTILSPAHFYAILPLGTRSLDGTVSDKQVKPGQFGDVESTETLDDLLGALNEEYGSKIFHAGSLILRAPGEIVAARFSKDAQWYRARILQATEDKVKVFYVDFGNSEWLSARELREMKPQFLHLPFQALECFLYNVEATGHNGEDANNQWSNDAKKYFHTLVNGKTLVGHVKSKWWNGVLFVELYDTSKDCDVNVGEALVSAQFAAWASARSTSSCPSESGASTVGSGVRMIPG